jgi:hypothetical protein
MTMVNLTAHGACDTCSVGMTVTLFDCDATDPKVAGYQLDQVMTTDETPCINCQIGFVSLRIVGICRPPFKSVEDLED